LRHILDKTLLWVQPLVLALVELPGLWSHSWDKKWFQAPLLPHIRCRTPLQRREECQ
jgi:hypothetical protein